MQQKNVCIPIPIGCYSYIETIKSVGAPSWRDPSRLEAAPTQEFHLIIEKSVIKDPKIL